MTVKLSTDLIEKSTLLLENKNLNELNANLEAKTGLKTFFKSYGDYDTFKELLSLQLETTKEKGDLGDFQTPKDLTDKVCQYLSNTGINPLYLIEPTCGTGNFVISAIEYFPKLKYIYCIELQKQYEWYFKLNLLCKSFEHPITTEIAFHNDNIFTHRFSAKFLQLLNHPRKRTLILGNPPWITNTELSVLNSDNIPIKSNLKGHRGIDAITGKGNFDIAEYIILQIIKQFSKYHAKIAMLCKTSVIKNMIKDIDNLNIKLSNINALQIDAKKEFSISADAALFLADLGIEKQNYCTVSSLYEPKQIQNVFGWTEGKFVSDIENYKRYKFLDGHSELMWRQGVKHDATKIMILKKQANGAYKNGINEIVDIENDFLYPFVKSSDLQQEVINSCNKKVIITQISLKDDTTHIASTSPKLWNYLLNHAEHLDNRKSIIYRNRPRFSIFGIGKYAFKPYRVGISGFYKTPTFALIVPISDKPVMLDDTCYYLSFEELDDAFFTWVLLNRPEIAAFLKSIVFLDAKRPYTKEKLMRITLLILLNTLPFEEILEFYKRTLKKHFPHDLNEESFLNYKNRIFPMKKTLLDYL